VEYASAAEEDANIDDGFYIFAEADIIPEQDQLPDNVHPVVTEPVQEPDVQSDPVDSSPALDLNISNLDTTIRGEAF
jgi:hypothetical protein